MKPAIASTPLLFVVLSLLSCQETPIAYPDGGYDYPKTIEDSNHFFYPLRDSLLKRNASSDPHDFLFPFFDEPNLSLRPKPKETFRFFLFGFKQLPLVIVLTQNEILVKKAHSDEFFVDDTSVLTELERVHYKIVLDKYSQYYKYSHLWFSKKSSDSLLKLYPYLFTKKYRKYLREKAVKIPNKAFAYSSEKKAISFKQYYKLVSQINESGYWKFPIHLSSNVEYTDGFSYILEANTAKKYKFVNADEINEQEQFRKACQALIDAAGMGKKYEVYRWSNTNTPSK